MRVIGNTLHSGNLRISFRRTLRIPDDGNSYPLPPNAGQFPVRKVDDYADRVPQEWLAKGGVMIPMHSREAMWIAFERTGHAPYAVKVGVGKVNAVNGSPWTDALNGESQDYLVVPPQKWIDGIVDAGGNVKQFIAVRRGGGHSVEAQVTGEEKHNGLQLAVYPGKPERFPKPKPRNWHGNRMRSRTLSKGVPISTDYSYGADACVETTLDGGSEYETLGLDVKVTRGMDSYSESVQHLHHTRARKRVNSEAATLGMGAGGSIKQNITPDKHGVDAWDQSNPDRLFVHLVNAEMWKQITGEYPPATPIDRGMYNRFNIPWFDIYDDHLGTVQATTTLVKVKTTTEIDIQNTGLAQESTKPLHVGHVTSYKSGGYAKDAVRDGNW